jgi:hypothetical protein
MSQPAPNCPECGGSHFTRLEFRRYRSGNTPSAVGPGLVGVTKPIPIPICLCGRVLRVDTSYIPESLLANLNESHRRALHYRRGHEERQQNWAAQMVDASELEKRIQDIRRLKQLAQFPSHAPPKVSK